MLRIELTGGAQLEVARWAVVQVGANLLEQCEEGVSDLLDQLPVIQGHVLLISDERRGELSVADEFCHVVLVELERALDIYDGEWLEVVRAGGELGGTIRGLMVKSRDTDICRSAQNGSRHAR
jgi:hypothetical protein